MGLRDLQKWLNKVQGNNSNNNNITTSHNNDKKEEIDQLLLQKEEIKLLQSERFKIFRDKPFWISNIEEHKHQDILHKGACCFNHIIGLPRKDGVVKPIFDYEQNLVKTLDTYNDIWIKKARGLGVTEILLRYMSWLAVRNNSDYSGKRFHIVTGPRIDLAEELINRIRLLFAESRVNPQIELKTAGPILYLNNATIEAFPSHHLDAMRGYTDVAFILVDEGDFFIPSQQEECRMVVEGYRLKTKPKIVMVSTPYRPGGLFQQIELDPDSPYHKLFLHYSIGVGKIYNAEEIEKERQQFYFKREYELNYSVAIGNIFTEPEIEGCEELGKYYTKLYYEQYKTKDYVNTSTQKSMGIDWGFGSSKTAFVVTEFVDGICRIIYAKEFASQSVDEMINHAYRLIRIYNLDNWENKTFVDGSSTGNIRSLKNAISGTNETVDYHLLVKKATEDKRPLDLYMQIVPVNFSTDGKQMLDKVKKYISKKWVAIDPSFEELLTELRVATANEEMQLDKHIFSMDLLDALRLSMCYYK